MSEPAWHVDYSGLLQVLAGGLGNVADKVIACLNRADRQSLGLACKALQDEVAARWRCLRVGYWHRPAAEVLRSKLLPKLRGVEELDVDRLVGLDTVQDFYRLLLALKRNGARVKAITVISSNVHPLRLPARRSARLGGQPPEQLQSNWVLAADTLQQLQPVPHLERLELRLYSEVDAALLQSLLRASAQKTVQLIGCNLVTSSSLDLSACSQLQVFELRVQGDAPIHDLSTCLQGLQPASCLKTLRLYGFDARSQWLEYVSRSFPNLELLFLCDCRLPEPDVSASQHELQQPSLFPSLKELSLVGFYSGAASSDLLALRHLFGATRLQGLFLTFEGLSDEDILDLLPLDSPGLANLEELSIHVEDTPRHIVVALLAHLARNQRRLQRLTLVKCGSVDSEQHLTTQDVQTFLDAAPPGLKELRLNGFPSVQPARLALPAAIAGVRLDIRTRVAAYSS